jgi:hypothetical protein
MLVGVMLSIVLGIDSLTVTPSTYDFQHKQPSACMAGCIFYWHAECRYASCHPAECRGAKRRVYLLFSDPLYKTF